MKKCKLFTFEFENGQTLQLASMGAALEYAHEHNTRIVRSY